MNRKYLLTRLVVVIFILILIGIIVLTKKPLKEQDTNLTTEVYNQTWLNFDGVDDWVNLTNSSTFDLSHNFTYIIYFNPKKLDSTGQVLFSKGNATTNFKGIMLRVKSDGLLYSDLDNVITSDACTADSKRLSNDNLYQASLSYDYEGYISGGINGINCHNTRNISNVKSNVLPLLLGARSSSLDRQFNGSIYEFKVYNRVLTPAQLAQEYRENVLGANLTFIPVFYTHHLDIGNDLDNVTFDSIMSNLNSSGWKSITDVDYYNWTQGKINISQKSFMIIWDDGQYQTLLGASIMAKYGFRGVTAINTGLVDNCSNRREGNCTMNTTAMNYTFMNWTDVKYLVNHYNWTVASHSVVHCNMNGYTGGTFNITCSSNTVASNMSQSKQDIINHVGVIPISFVFPYNSWNASAMVSCSLNYTLCFGSDYPHSQQVRYITQKSNFTNGELYRITLSGGDDYLNRITNFTYSKNDGLIGNWRFNQNSGTTVYDSSGNGNNGTISGATWQSDHVLVN